MNTLKENDIDPITLIVFTNGYKLPSLPNNVITSGELLFNMGNNTQAI